MKVLSLFDGISCGMVALERAGIPVERYVAYEIDKYAIKISEKNYPQIEHRGDVSNADFSMYEGFDLVIGGFPCQDLSVAGKRAGLEGSRSGLFWELVRAIETIKPKYFLVENNFGMPKEAEKIITETLGVEPVMINSALVSAQQRKRLYWTNIPNVTQPENKGITLKDIILSETNEAPVKMTERNMRHFKNLTDKSLACTATMYKGAGNNGTTLIPVRLGNIGETTAQANRVYSVEGKSVALKANGGGLGAKTGLYMIDLPDSDFYIRKLTPLECERLQTLPDQYTEGVSDTRRYQCIGNGWTVDVITHILKGVK